MGKTHWNQMDDISKVHHFIEKFALIPKKNWNKGQLVKDDKRCALGHCGVTVESQLTDEAVELGKLYLKYLPKTKEFNESLFVNKNDAIICLVGTVNDSFDVDPILELKQYSAKRHTLFALHVIKQRINKKSRISRHDSMLMSEEITQEDLSDAALYKPELV
ncbi:MAG: hypothetical protein IH946_11585 [Bacteroidetes bacterium]|nr:hypothetical protein [Bacteroidota bacterium]